MVSAWRWRVASDRAYRGGSRDRSETLREHVRRAQVDAGKREGLTTNEREELKRLRKENFELRRANTILKEASVYFAQELDPNRPS